MPNYRVHIFVVLLLVVAGVFRSFGEEKQFPAHNCAITVPEGWQSLTEAMNKPGIVAAFASADRMKLLMVMVSEKNEAENTVMDEKYIRNYEAGIEHGGGGKRLWGRPVEVAGIKGYERLGEVKVNGRNMTSWTRAVLGDGKHHSVQGMRVEGDASEDSEIRGAVGSFRFLKPPAVPAQSSPASSSASYKFGYAAGQTAMWILVIAAVIFAVAKATNKKTPPNGPPPVPRG